MRIRHIQHPQFQAMPMQRLVTWWLVMRVIVPQSVFLHWKSRLQKASLMITDDQLKKSFTFGHWKRKSTDDDNDDCTDIYNQKTYKYYDFSARILQNFLFYSQDVWDAQGANIIKCSFFLEKLPFAGTDYIWLFQAKILLRKWREKICCTTFSNKIGHSLQYLSGPPPLWALASTHIGGKEDFSNH